MCISVYTMRHQYTAISFYSYNKTEYETTTNWSECRVTARSVKKSRLQQSITSVFLFFAMNEANTLNSNTHMQARPAMIIYKPLKIQRSIDAVNPHSRYFLAHLM